MAKKLANHPNDQYGHWLNNIKCNPIKTKTNIFDEYPYSISELSHLFTELPLSDLIRNWVSYILDSISFDEDWSVADFGRALIVLKLRFNDMGFFPVIHSGNPPLPGLKNAFLTPLTKTILKLKPDEWFRIPYDKIVHHSSITEEISAAKKHSKNRKFRYYQDQDGDWIILRESIENQE